MLRERERVKIPLYTEIGENLFLLTAKDVC